MKKSIKILIIIIVVIGVFIGLMYLNPIINDWKLNNERINDSKTLTRYIENHDQEHTYAMNGTYEFLGIDIKDFDTKLLGDSKVLYFDYKNDRTEWILVLDNNKIYGTIFGTDKIYSNNKKYIELDLGINIKTIQFRRYGTILILSEDNKSYMLDKYNMKVDQIDNNSLTNRLLKDTTIIKAIDISTNIDSGVYAEYLVLKTDGQVYKQSFGLIMKVEL